MNMFTKIRGNIISCIIVLIIGIMGCYAGYNIYYNHNDSSITYNQKQETVTVNHLQGTTVVPKNPKRVVVMDIGVLDSLDYLDIHPEMLATCSYYLPKYIDKYKDNTIDIGQMKNVDIEKINATKPDLIIISGRQSPYYKQLSEIAPTIDLSIDNNNYLVSFENKIRILGEIFDKEDMVTNRLFAIKSKIDTIRADSRNKNKYGLLVLTTGNSLHAYGPGMRYSFVFDVFGLQTVVNKDRNEDTKSPGGKTISYEYILETNPDYIMVIDRDFSVNLGESAKRLFDNDLIKKTKAYQTNNIYYLDSDIWYLSGGGLESIDIMMDDISNILNNQGE